MSTPPRDLEPADIDQGLTGLYARLAASTSSDEQERVRDAISRFEREYRCRAWARYYVTPSGRSIHASTTCARARHGRAEVAFTRLDDVSGVPVREVALTHGTRLCSSCFPQAPHAWTSGGPIDADVCEAGGLAFVDPSQRVECGLCGRHVPGTSLVMKRHAPALTRAQLLAAV